MFLSLSFSLPLSLKINKVFKIKCSGSVSLESPDCPVGALILALQTQQRQGRAWAPAEFPPGWREAWGADWMRPDRSKCCEDR